MKKQIWLVIILAIVIIILAGFLILWPIKQPAKNTQNTNPPPVKVVQEGISVDSPKASETISSPVKITGTTNGGGWNGFEGQVGIVQLLDYKGNKIGEAILKATTDWTKPPVSFEANLTFKINNPGPATLFFSNENPSGLPDKDKKFGLSVVTSSSETMTVKPFFAKTGVTGSTCSVVFSVDRTVPKTDAVARAALEELLKGPTDSEKSAGFYSNINPGVKINSLTITNGVARVDFSKEMETTGGSCKVTEIRSEINFTLKQFPTVKSVIISINGRTEDILQP